MYFSRSSAGPLIILVFWKMRIFWKMSFLSIIKSTSLFNMSSGLAHDIFCCFLFLKKLLRVYKSCYRINWTSISPPSTFTSIYFLILFRPPADHFPHLHDKSGVQILMLVDFLLFFLSRWCHQIGSSFSDSFNEYNSFCFLENITFKMNQGIKGLFLDIFTSKNKYSSGVYF